MWGTEDWMWLRLECTNSWEPPNYREPTLKNLNKFFFFHNLILQLLFRLTHESTVYLSLTEIWRGNRWSKLAFFFFTEIACHVSKIVI